MKVRFFIICILAVCSIVAYGQPRNRSAVNQQKIEELRKNIREDSTHLKTLMLKVDSLKKVWFNICHNFSSNSENQTDGDWRYLIENTYDGVDSVKSPQYNFSLKELMRGLYDNFLKKPSKKQEKGKALQKTESNPKSDSDSDSDSKPKSSSSSVDSDIKRNRKIWKKL